MDKPHMAKVSLADLGLFWAKGYDLKEDEELGNVITHFDDHTRTAIIEYTTKPKEVQKVKAKRKGKK